MVVARAGHHAVQQIRLSCQTQARHVTRRSFITRAQRPSGSGSGSTRLIVLAISAGAGLAFTSNRILQAESPQSEDGEPVIEQPRRRRDGSKEANRDAISSQHVQVKQSWENPGVFTFGSNTGRVADPGSKDSMVKNPRRISFFDGHVLRDLKLDRNFGAAIDAIGDLYIWGDDYEQDTTQPQKILSGKKLKSLAISKDRIFALDAGGRVFSVPVSKSDQLSGERPYESSWVPFWPSRSPVAYKIVEIPDKIWGEKITSVSAGLEHAILLTSSGRLFSMAASSTEYPSRGQLGVPGITSWETKPAGPYDRPHAVSTLHGFRIASIASGDFHSIVLDQAGRVFGFGDNSSGQLGIDVSPEAPYVDAPSLLNTGRLYSGTGQSAKVTSVTAGGSASFITVDATRVASANDDLVKESTRAQLGKVTADVWAFGQGIWGTLGTGRWTHVQAEPAKVRALSGLFEYDELRQAIVPIRLARISVGSTHAAAILANETNIGSGSRGSSNGFNDVNWGADVLLWGGNEHYQLGTGRRANVNTPTYIGPLERIGDGSRRDEHRLHLTPPARVTLGTGSGGITASVGQTIECGRMVSAVYSKIFD